MKCNSLLKVKPLQYMTIAVAMSFIITLDSHALMNPVSWNEDTHGALRPNGPNEAVPIECPPIAVEDILAYANNPTTRSTIDQNWTVTRTKVTVPNLKAGDISSPKLECRPDGSRIITYKAKSGNTYIEQEATAFPKKKN